MYAVGTIMALKIAGGVEGIHAVIMRLVARRAELASGYGYIRCETGFSTKGRPLHVEGIDKIILSVRHGYSLTPAVW